MLLSDILSDDKPVRLLATTRERAIREMVLALVKAGQLSESLVESSIKALLGREQLGTTALGNGVAVPHARTASQPNMVACFGISKSGIDWMALDAKPVRVVFMLLSGTAQGSQNFEALAVIARNVRDVAFIKELLDKHGDEGT